LVRQIKPEQWGQQEQWRRPELSMLGLWELWDQQQGPALERPGLLNQLVLSMLAQPEL
jgi:hypothetical protein